VSGAFSNKMPPGRYGAMEILNQFLDQLTGLIPTGAAVIVTVIVLMAVRFFMNKKYAGVSGSKFRYQMVMLLLSFVALLVVILTLPVSESNVGQLLSLLGLLLSAAIALSATTFVGNVMAGLMLRAVRNFRGGDFIRVGDHFGRVSERGLFHIEIQTEDRDLTTLPNLYLVTNPVKVIRSSGTLVTAEVSLGYDLPRDAVKTSLLTAANDAGLEEAFVHVMNLGDFSVTYRVAGLLTDVKGLLTTRSRLRGKMLDRLHEAGIEIVSPAFMNQRVLPTDRTFIPARAPQPVDSPDDKELPEAVVFDKADDAESLEMLRKRAEGLQKEIAELKTALDDSSDQTERKAVEAKLTLSKERLERLKANIVKREREDENE
jgi:small-conductance mechanosensitive channel